MNAGDRYILNVNDGVDTIHRSPTLERCNADQIEGRSNIDAKSAAALLASGQAQPCQHCIGPDQPEA